MVKRIRERILPSVVTFFRTPAGAAGPVQFNRQSGDRIEIVTGECPSLASILTSQASIHCKSLQVGHLSPKFKIGPDMSCFR
jgi:hypothetical protein